MAKTKKQPTFKSAVTMRFKNLVNGKKSIYLDIYKNGTRCYEFLKDEQGHKLVLYPDAPEFKKVNDATMMLAKAAQLKKETELLNTELITKDKKQIGKVLLLDWVQSCINAQLKKKAEGKKNTAELLQYMYVNLSKFAKPNTRLCDVDKQYCLDYISYLRTAKVMCWADRKHEPSADVLSKRKTISRATASVYFIGFSFCLKEAYKQGYIKGNPASLLDKDDRIEVNERTPIYLTEEELIAFARVEHQTECEKNIKQAFLFGCFTGYRLSDIKNLTWGDIEKSNGKMLAKVLTKKTQKYVYNPINASAQKFMPEQGNKSPKDLVFDLHYSPTWVEKVLCDLSQRAGITKHITFHKSRHTCATFMLTRGTAITTVQKVLGHSDLQTTMRYAHVIDDALIEASDAINIEI